MLSECVNHDSVCRNRGGSQYGAHMKTALRVVIDIEDAIGLILRGSISALYSPNRVTLQSRLPVRDHK